MADIRASFYQRVSNLHLQFADEKDSLTAADDLFRGSQYIMQNK